MCKIILVFILMSCSAFSQMKIQDGVYSIAHNVPCGGTTIDIKIPLLHIYDEKDAWQVVNDSIDKIVDEAIGEYGALEYMECDSTDWNPPDSYTLDYKVITNTDKLFSLTLQSEFGSGNGGHGSEGKIYCFNADLKNNRVFTIDSLFDKSNKKKIEKLLVAKKDVNNEEKLLKGFKDIFVEHSSNVHFHGISIDTGGISFYFQMYFTGNFLNVYEIRLSYAEIKKYLRKDYLWLCNQNTKP